MADKEITIKLNTEADISEIENLNDLLEVIKGNASETGEELKTAFEEATNEVEELTEELANIELGLSDADYDEVTQQLEEATDKANELEEALNNIDSGGLDDASGSADDLTGSLDDASSSANELSDSMGLIESTMLMDMANQIGAIGDQAEGTAQELDNVSISVGQLATNTGIAEPQMRNLIAHISNVTFPQDEAIAYVNALNQMGVSADKLGDSATNMDKINDATGMGYDKVIQLTQGLRALGVSADNLPSSFNALAYAEANVNGGSELLGTVLRRQAGTLNEYGMNVDATVVALSALQRQTGLAGMKLGSEFSKRLKDCNGDLGALEQSLGLSSGALSNASNETSKYSGKLQQLADEEMEHKTLTERLGAVWEDFALQMDWLISPLSSVIGLIGSFGQVTLAINSIMTLAQTFGILTTATETATVAQMSLNLAFLSNPITWIVIAIIALIVVLGYLYFNNEQVRNAIDNLGATIMGVAGAIYNAIAGFFTWLWSVLANLPVTIETTVNNIISGISRFITWFASLPSKIGNYLSDMIRQSVSFASQFVTNIVNAGVNAVTGFINAIKQMGQALVQEFNHMLQSALEFAGRLPQIIWDTAVNMVWSWVGGSGEHSPGFMSEAFEGDIGYMEQRALNSTLPVNMNRVASDMIGGFRTDFNNGNVTGGMGQVNNFYFEDIVVDNEERMERIVDYVAKTIHWNNTTAGRTV